MNRYSVTLNRDVEALNKEDAILQFCQEVSDTEDDGFEVEELPKPEPIAMVCPDCEYGFMSDESLEEGR